MNPAASFAHAMRPNASVTTTVVVAEFGPFWAVVTVGRVAVTDATWLVPDA